MYGRTIEIQVLIDDVDTSLVGLHQLRRGVTIVPQVLLVEVVGVSCGVNALKQDSVMFSGSLRFNLDPWGEESEEELGRVVGVLGLDLRLDCEVTEGGGNLSQGQRQLVCLGRAILRRSKLLILDEATSALDSHTDARIATLLKTEFSECSVITIAHRLATVVEADRVLVLEHGRLVELGDPQVLNHIRSTQILHHFLHIHNSDDLNNLHRSCCPTQAPTSVGWPPWPESPPSKPKYQCGSEGQELSVFTLFIYIMQSITRKEKHITE